MYYIIHNIVYTLNIIKPFFDRIPILSYIDGILYLFFAVEFYVNDYNIILHDLHNFIFSVTPEYEPHIMDIFEQTSSFIVGYAIVKTNTI